MIGWHKSLEIPIDDILYRHSYVNLCMYAAACPQYDDTENTWDESVDMCQESNIQQGAEAEYIY